MQRKGSRMNVNLVIDPNSEPVIDHENVVITNLDNIPISSCQSLIINSVLNYLTNDQLQLILTKVRHQGTISISCVDAVLLTSAFYRNEIDLPTLSSLVRGSNDLHTLVELQTMFQNNGYMIESAGTTDNLSFYLKVTRP